MLVRRHLLDQACERVLDAAVLPAAGSALMHQWISQDLYVCSVMNWLCTSMINRPGGTQRALGITAGVGTRG